MLRKYNELDIENIVKLEEEVIHSSLGYDFYKSDLSNPFAYHYVLEDNGFKGFISSVFDGDIAEVLNLGICVCYQGNGYGYKMLSCFTQFIKDMGGSSIVLEVRSSNNRAILLYEKCGFKTIRIRKKYYSNGEDALYMQKIID